MDNDCWIDESGGRVDIFPGFSNIYRDEISRELDLRYNFSSSPKKIGGLGNAEVEVAADGLMNLCYTFKGVVGVENNELYDLGMNLSSRFLFGQSWDYEGLLSREMLRDKKVKGRRILFPTEKLVKKAFNLRD